MANLKHVGRLTSNRRKIAVVYRVLPNDPEHCLIVDTASLTAQDHDSLIRLIESDTAQSSTDLADAMARSRLADGSVMLSAFHKRGKLQRVRTDAVELTPNTTTAVKLSEINQIVAEQQGITVADLAPKENNSTQVQTVATAQEVPSSDVLAESQAARIDTTGDQAAVAPADGVLTDDVLAAQYRSQADALFKEAQALRKQAEELVPTKKKTKAKA